MRTILDSVAPGAAPAERDLEEFLRTVRPRLRALLGRHRIPPEDSEDLLQQTLLALAYQWDRVRDPDAWLVGTVRNQCRFYWRRKRRALYEAVDAAMLEWLAPPQPSPEDRRDLWRDFETVLERMPSRCRRLLRLRYQFGYDTREVAEQTGYSPLSVGKTAHRCLAELARRLGTAEGGADGSDRDGSGRD